MVIELFWLITIHTTWWWPKHFGRHLTMYDNHVWLVHGNAVRWWLNFFNHQILWVPLVFGVPLIWTILGALDFHFSSLFFDMYDSSCFEQLMCNTSKKGGGTPCILKVIFVISIFFTKQNMSRNQVEGEIIQQACKRDDQWLGTMRGYMWYISKAKKNDNMMWIFFDCWKI